MQSFVRNHCSLAGVYRLSAPCLQGGGSWFVNNRGYLRPDSERFWKIWGDSPRKMSFIYLTTKGFEVHSHAVAVQLIQCATTLLTWLQGDLSLKLVVRLAGNPWSFNVSLSPALHSPLACRGVPPACSSVLTRLAKKNLSNSTIWPRYTHFVITFGTFG